MAEESHLLPSIAEKHSCCSIHLKPLLERINALEHKLLIETERRQNEYNELLHILLTVKRNKKDANSPQKSHPQTVKPLSKHLVTGQITTKKNKQANGNSAVDLKACSKRKSEKKNSKPLRKSSQSVKRIQINAPSASSGLIQRQNPLKDESIAQTLERQNSEINKVKQLSNYLMQQLLMLFENVKEIQAGSNQGILAKNIPTQETITSIVFDASQKQAMMRNESLANESQFMEQKMQKLQAMIISNSNALQEQHAKISEHQSMLSELKALTRGLSNRIVQIPLYLNSSYDASPNKA